MASLAVGIIGAGVGFAVGGPAGAKWGWAVGQVVGGMLFPPRLGPQGSGRLDDLKVSGSAYNTPIPIIYGQMRVPGIFIWSPDLVEVSSGGGKGATKGKAPTGARYTSSFAVAFCEGEVAGIKRIWADDMLIYENGVLVEGFGEITIYVGDETQTADPLIEADKGVGNVSGHRGLCYVVFEEMPLDKFGNRRPNISAEIEGSELAYDSILRSSLEAVCIKRADGSFWAGGDLTNTLNNLTLAEVDASIDLACGSKGTSSTILYIDDTGQLWASGHNNSASQAGVSLFGNGITTATHTGGSFVNTHGGNALPNLGTGNLDFASILSRAYLVKSDNTLWFWGEGGTSFFPAFSNRGDGSTSAASTPVQVGSDTVQVAVGALGALRLKTDGTVQYTGQGGGWMGNNTTTNVTSWTNSNITDVVKVAGNQSAAGAGHASLAVKSDGTAWACGVNDNNVLGNTSLGSGDVLTWQQIDVDGAFIIDIRGCVNGGAALDNAGQVWGWGEGHAAGQGVTGTTQRNPAVILTNVRAIGNTHAALFAITDTDDVYAWGDGSSYQRGDNSTTDLSTPTLMPWGATRQGETVQSILEDVSTRVGLESGDVDFSACGGSSVTGYALFNRDEARNLIDPLIRCHFVDVFEVDGQVLGEIRGGSVTHTIDEDDMQAHETGSELPPFCEHKRGNEKELPARIDLSFFTHIRDYDEMTQSATRVTNPQAYDAVSVRYPGTLSQSDGRHISEALLYEQWVQRDSFNVSVGPKHMGIVPTDRPQLPVEPGGSNVEMKVAKADFSVFGLQKLELVKHDPNIYTQVAQGASIEPTTTTLFELQPTQIFAFAAPAINDADALDGNFGVYVAMTAEGGRWDGAVMVSDAYNSSLTFGERSVCGLTTTILATPTVLSTGVWDTVSTVTVDIIHGTLGSVDRVDVLNGANRAYIGDVNGGEYIGFSTVTSLGNGVYQLSDLLRGQRGTDTNWGGHAVGDQFVLLDDTVQRYVPPTAGTTMWYGRDIDLYANLKLAGHDDLITVNVDGSEIVPYSVADVVAERDGGNNITLTWKRRTRAGGEWADLVDVPLSEFDERYRVDFMDPTGVTVERSSSVTAETATYSAADQTTDGYTPGDPVKIRIHQIGAWPMNTGAGFDVDGFAHLLEV